MEQQHHPAYSGRTVAGHSSFRPYSSGRSAAASADQTAAGRTVADRIEAVRTASDRTVADRSSSRPYSSDHSVAASADRIVAVRTAADRIEAGRSSSRPYSSHRSAAASADQTAAVRTAADRIEAGRSSFRPYSSGRSAAASAGQTVTGRTAAVQMTADRIVAVQAVLVQAVTDHTQPDRSSFHSVPLSLQPFALPVLSVIPVTDRNGCRICHHHSTLYHNINKTS